MKENSSNPAIKENQGILKVENMLNDATDDQLDSSSFVGYDQDRHEEELEKPRPLDVKFFE